MLCSSLNTAGELWGGAIPKILENATLIIPAITKTITILNNNRALISLTILSGNINPIKGIIHNITHIILGIEYICLWIILINACGILGIIPNKAIKLIELVISQIIPLLIANFGRICIHVSANKI